jgi:hypothetical protein
VQDRESLAAPIPLAQVRTYLARKQHLLPGSQSTDLVQATRDVGALHATVPTAPYLSLWARVSGFQRQALDDALYERRALARLLCMRSTLHLVASDQLALFLQAYAGRRNITARQAMQNLLVQAGLCEEAGAGQLLDDLHDRVLEVARARGPCTVSRLSRAVPQLRAKVRHDVGKPYEGEFSIGSRLVPGMCELRLLIRARPRGTWRSNLYEYAVLSDWLPAVDLGSVTPAEAQAWLVRRYLAAFGPVTFEDVQWWTGFSRGETEAALASLSSELVEVRLEDLEPGHLLLARESQQLAHGAVHPDHYVFFLPGLDPYIMGYRDRRRFLDPEHRTKVFDRAGNAMPTVWIDGQVAGVWSQGKEGTVIYGLFQSTGETDALVAAEAQRLEAFLGGEVLPQRSHTPFLRALSRQAVP